MPVANASIGIEIDIYRPGVPSSSFISSCENLMKLLMAIAHCAKYREPARVSEYIMRLIEARTWCRRHCPSNVDISAKIRSLSAAYERISSYEALLMIYGSRSMKSMIVDENTSGEAAIACSAICWFVFNGNDLLMYAVSSYIRHQACRHGGSVAATVRGQYRHADYRLWRRVKPGFYDGGRPVKVACLLITAEYWLYHADRRRRASISPHFLMAGLWAAIKSVLRNFVMRAYLWILIARNDMTLMREGMISMENTMPYREIALWFLAWRVCLRLNAEDDEINNYR